MSDLLIDAPMLACPDPRYYSHDEFQGIFLDFLSRLSDLSDLRLNCKSVSFWRDVQLAEVLYEENSYPFRHSLAAAFAALFEECEFQLEDINVLATALLEKSLRLELSGVVQEVVVSSCVLSGDPVRDRSPGSIEHLCKMTCMALPILGDGKSFYPNVYLVSKKTSSESVAIEVQCAVDLILQNDESYNIEAPPVLTTLPLFLDSSHFCGSVDLVKWWSRGTEDSILDACAIQAGREERDIFEIFSSVRKNLRIGPMFIATARTFGFMHDPKKISRILRVCVDIILRRNLADSHWLRDGKGAGEAQKSKGKLRAWRHDIDYEFHLHYWRNGDIVELANIVSHNDASIT